MRDRAAGAPRTRTHRGPQRDRRQGLPDDLAAHLSPADRTVNAAARVRSFLRAALRDLPEQYAEALDNIEFVVARTPSRRDRVRNGLGNAVLYGFYEGTPLTQRDSGYGNTVPDRITVYWGTLARDFPDDGSLEREVRNTVYHEIAHYFGLDEDDLHGTRVR